MPSIRELFLILYYNFSFCCCFYCCWLGFVAFKFWSPYKISRMLWVITFFILCNWLKEKIFVSIGGWSGTSNILPSVIVLHPAVTQSSTSQLFFKIPSTHYMKPHRYHFDLTYKFFSPVQIWRHSRGCPCFECQRLLLYTFFPSWRNGVDSCFFAA